VNNKTRIVAFIQTFSSTPKPNYRPDATVHGPTVPPEICAPLLRLHAEARNYDADFIIPACPAAYFKSG
jgi:hypothetical protein